MPDLSVVTTLYRSEPFVLEFYERITAAASALTSSYEVIFVDDGSPDAGAAVARRIVRNDPRVVLVELSRNFGHHQAAMAGLQQARGRRVFIIDVDLEEKPEWLPGFAAALDASGADVVYGQNQIRRGTLGRRLFGGVFWKLFNALSETQIPENPCTIRLMSRRYVDALVKLPDKNLFLAGNYAWLGYRQVARPVEKGLRQNASTYTASRLIALFIEALTSFTSYPLRLIFVSGVCLACLSLFAGVGLILWKLLDPTAISLGWPSLMLSVWFLGGVTIAFIGVIGIYLSKVFNEAKGRPLFVVRDVHRYGDPTDPWAS